MAYIFGYGAFLVGAILYLLGKAQDFKQMAKANPDPKINYSTKNMLADEWINIVRLLLGGAALVVFAPMLVGNGTVDVKATSGAVIATMALKSVLVPLYFFVGYGGNSVLFNVLGRYKKTLLNRVGVDDDKP